MHNCEVKVLRALRKRMRVTRKTAIENGWSENLTATISDLRKKGYVIGTCNQLKLLKVLRTHVIV
jgi:hypothetical protein